MSKIEDFVIENGVLKKYNGNETAVVIPYGVNSVGEHAFEGCTSLTSITIGIGVTSIGSFAFSSCTNLTSITIPDSVTSIDSFAFSGCSSLEYITVDVNNPNYSSDERGVLFNKSKSNLIQYPIGNNATSYTIPDSVTSIEDSVFSGCTSLTNIIIPDSVTSIGSDAFDGTAYYNNISNWENGVLYIGNHLIKAKDTLFGNYSIREGTKTIAGDAFNYCTSLTSISIPEGVISIGWSAFRGCTRLTSIIIPDSVTSIGWSAFSGCTSLTSISIPEGVISIGWSAFGGCTSLTSVTIGNGVTRIESFAFINCTSLKSITIPDNVTSIGYNAFRDCTSLESITIPDNVTSIGGSAFSGCTNLKDIFYCGTAEEWERISVSYYDNEPLTNVTIHYNYVPLEPAHYNCTKPTPILSTDIRSFIFGSEISSYNINGNTGIVAEDLMGYGFTVIWDGNARTLSITHPSDDFTQPLKKNFGPKTGRVGERLASTLPTDIKTYINGKMVKSFNIGGQTVIYIDDLAVFGAVTWDGTARTISVE